MVDVDRRMASLSPSPAAHAAGLRRLSARAGAANTTSASAWTSHRGGLLSYRPMAESIAEHLRAASVPLLPGLSDAELAALEADFAFSFPPDLRALLAFALPSSPGFPDWRSHLDRRSYSGDEHQQQHDLLRLSFDLPLAAASLQVARGVLWPRSWGSRPADPKRALRQARSALRRAPVLVPIFGRCYIPSSPSLAGNPVFFVDEDQILCCGIDLADFFLRQPAFQPPIPHSLHHHQEQPLPPPTPCICRSVDAAVSSRIPRWIELWSDAASDRRRRNSSSSSSSCSSSETASSPPSPALDPARFSKSPTTRRQPEWLELYLDGIGSVLKQGGWAESEVDEMVRASTSDAFDAGDGERHAGVEPLPLLTAFVDAEAAVDSLLVTADWCSESLRLAGWSSDEVSDALLVDLVRRRRRKRRTPVELPPDVALKFEKLAKAVARS